MFKINTSSRNEQAKSFLAKHWPLLSAIIVFWLVVIIFLFLSLSKNNHHFIYMFDDAYIHMSVAKNFSQYGQWGVTPYFFTSTTSSILWPLLISGAYIIFGVNEITPFILNIIFGSIYIFLSYKFLKRYVNYSVYIFLVLLIVIFIIPLPTLVFSGMEHLLHALLTLLFLYSFILLIADKKHNNLIKIILLLNSLLLVMTRYEGIFLIIVACILLIIKRKIWYSFLLFLVGIIPIVIYGLISLSKGWYLVPNPIIIKSFIVNFSSFNGILSFFLIKFDIILSIFYLQLSILILFIILLFYFTYKNKRKLLDDHIIVMFILYFFTVLIHFVFARFDGFYRYDAYLRGLGAIVLSIGLFSSFLDNFILFMNKINIKLKLAVILVVVIPLVVLAITFFNRMFFVLSNTVQATHNIYEQQYQMGLFLKKYYEGKTIGANDIGAIDFLANIKIVDFVGLANMEVIENKRNVTYNSMKINEISEKNSMEIAIIYTDWLDEYGGLPDRWIRAGEWKIKNNVICGSDTVNFYAVDKSIASKLIRNLQDFSVYLPGDIVESGPYIQKD